ncbi:hypothetical protein AC482_02330 [miscellaneous Crenarchaeota group-15 archaeon DG-45]|uniref:DUF362 domain-containing protein n=1 Tax=miscellaneous Crenarchaeota group-15 archaeon DG-45 TaxID=1685127 RepID=A0A0M0BS13_9ARCH|nr:MAG: hypothetical protein AC482_02330 [miscellaneous Crenarchaeota group-15 archaeon DG-45]
MVSKAIGLIGGMDGIIGVGDRVLIKPNAGSESSRRGGVVTDPYVVEAIANEATEAGAGDVVIGEAAQVGADTGRVFEMNGYPEVAERTGARLLDLNEDEAVEVEVEGRLLRSVRVFRSALESDAVISVPVVKTHILAGVTIGLKNMKGVIPVEEKRRFHMLGLDAAIADLQLAIKPTMTVVDGILAMGGLGAPIHLGETVELGLIMAGVDPVAVDAVACRVTGFDPYDVKHLVYAAEHGLGSLDVKDAEIRGEPIERVRIDLEKPSLELREFDALDNLEVVQGGACSGCVGAVYSALKICDGMGELRGMPRTAFVLGPLAEPPGRDGEKVIIGRCLRRFRDAGRYVPGCPPLVVQVRDEVRELTGLSRLGGPKEDFLKAAEMDDDVER